MRSELIGTTIASRYRVTHKLGEGGMGTVYVAVQEPLGREVALKVIRGELTGDLAVVERFRREAMTLSQLAHPNIVTVFDFGVTDGLIFLAMELLPGGSLRDRIRQGALSPAATLPIIRDICSGLAVAHQAGVIHRDLKPDNIMLVDAFGRGEIAKILDFGIAKLAVHSGGTLSGGALTQAGSLIGTPGYMPAELTLHGVTDDPRSDLYALGVVWFEMLVGRALFLGQTPLAIVMKHATEPPPRPSELVPGQGISSAIERLVLQLLEKDPERRPASAAALLEQLDALELSPATPTPVTITGAPVLALAAAPTPLHLAPFEPEPVAARSSAGIMAGALTALLVIAGFAAAVYLTAPIDQASAARMTEAAAASSEVDAPPVDVATVTLTGPATSPLVATVPTAAVPNVDAPHEPTPSAETQAAAPQVTASATSAPRAKVKVSATKSGPEPPRQTRHVPELVD